jgi:hypothetical protein
MAATIEEEEESSAVVDKICSKFPDSAPQLHVNVM